MDRLGAHRRSLCRRRFDCAGGRLQCRSDRSRYLSDPVVAQGALLHPESRAQFVRILDQGRTDAMRSLHPNDPMYTYWSYLRDRWPRDAGLRIDHLLLSKEASTRLVASGVDRVVRGEENASDHAPVWIELRDVAPTRRAPGAAPKVASGNRRARKRKGRSHPTSSDRRPLLVIDGDSLRTRAYHALPKSIRRKGNRPAARFLALPICCSAYIAWRGRAPYWLVGTPMRSRLIGTKHSPRIRAGANSMTNC